MFFLSQYISPVSKDSHERLKNAKKELYTVDFPHKALL
jgi:hypothetical protein